jgi:ankyrin repeat protein
MMMSKLAAANLSTLRALLSAGGHADPHGGGEPYESPLVAARTNGHIRCVQLHIEAGADPSLHVGVSQRTAEIYAGLHGHAEILDYLLRLKR